MSVESELKAKHFALAGAVSLATAFGLWSYGEQALQELEENGAPQNEIAAYDSNHYKLGIAYSGGIAGALTLLAFPRRKKTSSEKVNSSIEP